MVEAIIQKSALSSLLIGLKYEITGSLGVYLINLHDDKKYSSITTF